LSDSENLLTRNSPHIVELKREFDGSPDWHRGFRVYGRSVAKTRYPRVMNWSWSNVALLCVPLTLGISWLVIMLNAVRDIRDSLRNIEERLKPRRDYEVEAGLPIKGETED